MTPASTCLTEMQAWSALSRQHTMADAAAAELGVACVVRIDDDHAPDVRRQHGGGVPREGRKKAAAHRRSTPMPPPPPRRAISRLTLDDARDPAAAGVATRESLGLDNDGAQSNV